jgi:hypothetical protein
MMYIIAEDLNTRRFGKGLYDLRSMRSDCVHVYFLLIQRSSGMKGKVVRYSMCVLIKLAVL